MVACPFQEGPSPTARRCCPIVRRPRPVAPCRKVSLLPSPPARPGSRPAGACAPPAAAREKTLLSVGWLTSSARDTVASRNRDDIYLPRADVL